MPDFECVEHPGIVINTTSIHNLLSNGHLGCVPCNQTMQRWSTAGKYEQLLAACDRIGARLLHTREEWPTICTGREFKPDLECLRHPGTIIKTTSIRNLVWLCNLGCFRCRNKTEAKLATWFEKNLSGTRHNVHKLKNPSTGKLDLSVDFDNTGLRLAVELDGNIEGGHFDPSPTNGCPTRDLAKEKQLRAKGYQVLRLLQNDVWHDLNGWENWLLGEIARWNVRREKGEPAEAARHPDAREYLGGIYAHLRSRN
tara:strand:- start:1460 stop:2224 length:765 start_codon:yes stop_codon:yes gene_type:complete